jgi:hypothetical protein
VREARGDGPLIGDVSAPASGQWTNGVPRYARDRTAAGGPVVQGVHGRR